MDLLREASSGEAPQALLLVAPGCPHCAGVLESLGTLVKEGALSRLEVVNVAVDPTAANALSVRSVPWVRIGMFDFIGLHTLAELRHWTEMASREDGMTAFLGELLATGRRHEVTRRIGTNPALLTRLVDLLGDPDTALSIRIGVMATLEEFAGASTLDDLVAPLEALTGHAAPRVRADACHALALTGATGAIDALRRCLKDPDPEVHETAADGIASLTEAQASAQRGGRKQQGMDAVSGSVSEDP